MEKEVQSEPEAVRIKKIGVLSLANLLAIMNVLIGLIFGIVILILTMLISPEGTVGDYLTSFGKYAVITLPIVYGVLGWISGILVGIFYNLGAKITKGIVLYA